MEKWKNGFPKTLIISANSLSSQSNNGKTLVSFFRKYPSESLAQLYIWPEYPDSILCKRYYRITDMEMLRSWFGYEPGGIVERKTVQRDNEKPLIFDSKIKNWHLTRLARDIIWLKNSWNTPKLNKWLEDFSPQIIFFLGINNPMLFKAAEYFSQKFHAPIITYVTDDYFLPRFSFSLAFHIRRKWLEYLMRHILHSQNTEMLVANRYMKEKYLKFFNKDSHIIFNCAVIEEERNYPTLHEGPIRGVYIGNLLNNRVKTLKSFCKILSGYPNKEAFRFEIYTHEPFTKKQIKELTLPPYLMHCGALDAQGVREKLEMSDLFLHIESFAYQNRKDTLLSLSTKLTEYMAAGRPIFMIGPTEIGSMRFLRENTSNIIVDKLCKKQIYSALDSLLDARKRDEIGAQNYETIKKLFNEISMYDLVRTASCNLLNKKGQE